MELWSHDVWKMRDSLIGREARSGGVWRVIEDVVPSMFRNAYTIKFEGGYILDMSTYDDVEIR